ncbi:MAG: hypothetical protein R3Y56_07075 [Akkermansia sp.]
MIDLDDWAKYLLYPLCKKGIVHLARLSRICLWCILICYLIALPISNLIHQVLGATALASSLYILGNYLAILVSLVLCALIALIFPWCHYVLPYQRGWDVTRIMSLLCWPAGLFIIISTLWSIMFGFTLLANQILAPFMTLMLIGLATSCNWWNMKVLSPLRRVGLLCIAPLLMLELLLGLAGLYFMASLVYLPLFLLLRPLLAWLQQHAPLIVALPPLRDDKSH